MKRLIRLDYADVKYPPPPGLIESLAAELARANLYSSGDYTELKNAYSRYSGVRPSQLLAGNGLDEVIDMVTRTWGRNVLIPAPTFSQFELAAKRNRSRLACADCFARGDYELAFPDDGLRKASLVWICSPNNPTGTRIPREDITRVLRKAKGMVCVDEAYYEFSRETVIDLLNDYENLVVLRGLSKGFGLAGLKVGFAISSEENIAKLERVRQIFNLNRLAEKAGAEVFQYSDYYDGVRARVIQARQRFTLALVGMGFIPLPSCTNFLLVKFSSTEEARWVCESLKQERVLALPAWDGEFTGLNGPFIRFSIGTEEDMVEAERRLEYILSRRKS